MGDIINKMAPIGPNIDRDTMFRDAPDDEDDKNLWANILEEVQKSSSKKLPSSKSILVLGDNEVGKTSLIAKLQSVEEPKKGAGLEYHYIDVKDEYREDSTRLGVWILDGDPYHSSLLKFTVNENTLSDNVIMLVVSLNTPWTIMESLHKWSSLIEDHIGRLRISPEKRKELEEQLVRQFQEYQDPAESLLSPRKSGFPSVADDDKIILPLGETTLTHNLGVPIVVIVTMADAISTLEKEHDYKEEHFDFIQLHIRKFCLNFGAALFYVSVKEEKNCDLLLKYLTHIIYAFPFDSPAYVVEKDCVFVPAGWDNEKKISILHENMTTMQPEDAFEEVVIKPIMRKPTQRDTDILAEEEQVFLLKQQAQLSKQPAPGQRQEGSPLRPQSVQKPNTSPRAGGLGSASTTPTLTNTPTKKLDPTKAGATSEGVLANFFNSLLSKKSGAPGAQVGVKPTDRAAVSRDAAAELDRIRTKKPVSPGPASNDSSTS